MPGSARSIATTSSCTAPRRQSWARWTHAHWQQRQAFYALRRRETNENGSRAINFKSLVYSVWVPKAVTRVRASGYPCPLLMSSTPPAQRRPRRAGPRARGEWPLPSSRRHPWCAACVCVACDTGAWWSRASRRAPPARGTGTSCGHGRRPEAQWRERVSERASGDAPTSSKLSVTPKSGFP